MAFQGFTDETFEFFMAIRFNNNREFFQSNHDWYMRAVRTPAVELAKALIPAIEQVDPELEQRPNRIVSRINRDIRFTHDKSPYRDHIWLGFRPTGTERQGTMALYFEISVHGGTCGLGFYGENKPLMNALRHDMLADPSKMCTIDRDLREAGYVLYGDAYKRMAVPETLPEELKKWYPKKGFYVEKEIPQFAVLKSEKLVDVLNEAFLELTPIYRLVAGLTPMEEDKTLSAPAPEQAR